MKSLLVVLLMLSPAVFAKSGGKGSGTCASTHASHRGGGMHARQDPRKDPPLATDRKVNEQDCSKPIDWSAGNVKCK
jgi:hypothetical protein